MAKSNDDDKMKWSKRGRNNNSSIKKSVREKFAEMLELPRDLVLDRPRLTMIGSSDMMIENYKSLLEYDDGRMRINTGTGIIRITGSDLVIREISQDDIVVSGTVRSVEFIDAG